MFKKVCFIIVMVLAILELDICAIVYMIRNKSDVMRRVSW